MFMSSEKRRFQGLTWTSQMPFMVEEISQLQLSLSQRDDPAPPNSPKPKPNANPKQPGFIGDDFDLADSLHDRGNYEPAPPDAPKPKPSPNPKQPDSTVSEAPWDRPDWKAQ
ncbi:uncharacterized protein [Macaca nemestrina]|uniref:uncharacterized protein isoform X3 n=1 Tax=Macaca nemestrina TaxID=9545 RepID=UPI0005F53EF7|nr:CD99 antigen-like isoform X2 [Macaca nemestrina]